MIDSLQLVSNNAKAALYWLHMDNSWKSFLTVSKDFRFCFLYHSVLFLLYKEYSEPGATAVYWNIDFLLLTIMVKVCVMTLILTFAYL